MVKIINEGEFLKLIKVKRLTSKHFQLDNFYLKIPLCRNVVQHANITNMQKFSPPSYEEKKMEMILCLFLVVQYFNYNFL